MHRRLIFQLKNEFIELKNRAVPPKSISFRTKMNGEDDHDNWLNSWEQQCAETIENQPDYDQSLAEENEHFQRRVWTSFQDSATAIAQLYRGKILHCTKSFSNAKGFLWDNFFREWAFIFSFSGGHFVDMSVLSIENQLLERCQVHGF